MNATPPKPTERRLCLLALGLLASVAMSGCVPAGGQLAGADDPDGCGAAASCDEPGQLEAQVRLDTDAMLAGIAHARARLGLQEDATP
jgi:hypothetical protein